MLDLNARVDFDEVRLVLRVDEKLERADVPVTRAHGGIDGELGNVLAKALADRRGRRLLDHLLIPSLDRALALAEADASARFVYRDLRLDVAHALEASLHVDAVVAKRCARLTRGLRPETLELGRRDRLAHAAPAAAGLGFQHDRIPDRLCDPQRLGDAADRPVRTRDDGHSRALHIDARLRLVVEKPQHLRRRPDEDEPVILADLGEVGVLRKEPVAGVDGLRAR